jgi:MFS family permease
MTDQAIPAYQGGRPTALLPLGQLARVSAYWLGLTAIDAAVGLFVQNRVNYGGFVQDLDVGRAQAVIGIGGAAIGIIIQPTVGTISDYAVTRWGRRKPFIVFGSLLDVVFLIGIAMSNSVIAMAAFVTLLAVSTNIARGPFQGYVPDLIAAPQVGMASALVGLMQILGNIVGIALVTLAIPITIAVGPGPEEVVHLLPFALLAVAAVELLTMVSVVWRVSPGQPPRPRGGRSWWSIAREAWGTDILRERSYIWLLASRFFYLMGGGILFNEIVVYLKQVHQLSQNDAAGVQFTIVIVIALATILTTIPASRLSDRLGRKPLIYAACAIGAVGIGIAAVAPGVAIATLGAALDGITAGMFLSVDWALMTDIIPSAAAGRYMGLSNVATGASSPVAVAIAGLIIDGVNSAMGIGTGPRVAFLVGAAFYVVAAVLLRPVDPTRREESIPEAVAA